MSEIPNPRIPVLTFNQFLDPTLIRAKKRPQLIIPVNSVLPKADGSVMFCINPYPLLIIVWFYERHTTKIKYVLEVYSTYLK